jgi:hypothetical protein
LSKAAGLAHMISTMRPGELQFLSYQLDDGIDLTHDEDLVHIGPDEVVELVEDAVNDLDEQVTLLVFERRGLLCACRRSRDHQ